MDSANERVAETILEDRAAEGHYRDAERLAFYLLGSFAPGSGLQREARAVADRLLETLDEATEIDPPTLADLIQEWTNELREKANRPR